MRVLVAAVAVLLTVACGGAPPRVTLPTAAPARDEAALARAVEAYYTAPDVAGLRAAVEAARQAGPEAAPALALAADLAKFEDRPFDRFEALLGALRDPTDAEAVAHLHALYDLDWTLPQAARADGLLRALATDHPDPEVRALAARYLADHALVRGDDAALATGLAGWGWRPALAVIGTWDNDQGKGFDAELPPEREIELQRRYAGRLVEVGWRTQYVADPRTHIDLAGLLEPSDWQVAYLAGAFQVAEAGQYELRLSTSDPAKVWVNDVQVFEARSVHDWVLDGFVVPVQLRAGVNRVLVKSAQETGTWLVSLRVTRPGGALVPAGGLVAVPPDTAYAEGGPPLARPGDGPLTPEALLAGRVAKLPADSAARAFAETRWADDTGLRVPAVTRAEALRAKWPKSLRARYELAAALWDNQERQVTADLLSGLVKEAGDELPYLRLQQARFWRQQNLGEQARAALVATRDRHPDRPSAWLALAEAFETEGWQEDRCAALEAADRRWPDWPRVQFELGDCYESLRFYPRAAEIYRALLRSLPNEVTALTRLHWHAQGNDDFETAERYARQLTEKWPHLRSSWDKLAETLRRKGDVAGARAALEQLVALAPTAETGYAKLAELVYQQGDREQAVKLWREALARNPDDEKLANRLAYLAPAQLGAWAADIPDAAALEAAVAQRAQVAMLPGADVVYLLDDEVTALSGDGSTVNYVTMVAHAVNDAGRDRLTRLTVRNDGRARVLHAYAVDPRGERTEASTIRGSSVRFRQLEVGTTVVLQYRLDSPPDGYLAGHLARQWWFQAPGAQTVVSRWVMWLPTGLKLVEAARGRFERDEKRVGDQLRVAWTARDTPPILPEPAMPTLHETAANLVAGTVPDWDMFLKWEDSLLRDAFRESPEVVAHAQRLFEGATTAEEKLARLQAWLMTEIRYQQDYEGFIAGVKPHAAPVVLSRRYGDCKDKAVLFITLAKLGGLEAHFALVRTRDAGPVVREVPMQQFNHAIVYVPAQPGVAEGRFFDPTVDALDVAVLRHDDQATWSLVIDPRTRQHTWREIPLQPAAVDDTASETTLRLAADGSAEGESRIQAQGRVGSALRRAARNPEQLAQMLEQQIGNTFSGARLTGHKAVQVTDVRAPARVEVSLAAPTVGRREGDELRLKVPIGWTPASYFPLSERKFDLLLGTPRTLRWSVDLVLPAGAKVKRLPSATTLAEPCLEVSREVTGQGERVRVQQTVKVLCERVAVVDYARYRAQSDQIQRMLDEELVVAIPGEQKRARAARK